MQPSTRDHKHPVHGSSSRESHLHHSFVFTPQFCFLLLSVMKSEWEHCVVGAGHSRGGREVSPESLCPGTVTALRWVPCPALISSATVLNRLSRGFVVPASPGMQSTRGHGEVALGGRNLWPQSLLCPWHLPAAVLEGLELLTEVPCAETSVCCLFSVGACSCPEFQPRITQSTLLPEQQSCFSFHTNPQKICCRL